MRIGFLGGFEDEVCSSCVAWMFSSAKGSIGNGNLYIAHHREVGNIGDKDCSPFAPWALVHNELACVTVL